MHLIKEVNKDISNKDVLIGGQRSRVHIRNRDWHYYGQYNNSGYKDSTKYNIYYFTRQKGKHL